jgi:hypothetical protein
MERARLSTECIITEELLGGSGGHAEQAVRLND